MATRKKIPPDQPQPSKRIKRLFTLPEDLIEEARDAVSALSGFPTYLRMAAFMETAVRAELDRLRKRHNKGKPFQPRPRNAKIDE